MRCWKAVAQASEQVVADVEVHVDVYVNQRVIKAFGDDLFEGVVVQFKPPQAGGEAAMWRVKYTDGDKEDLYLNELLFQVLRPAAASAPQRKKAKEAASHGGGGR